MIRRPVLRAAGLAAGICLLWGGTSLLRGAAAASAADVAQARPGDAPMVREAHVGMEILPPSVALPGTSSDSIASAGAVASGDGIAAIPLPPSAYPGMVGLATAALSVWRYRRRRR